MKRFFKVLWLKYLVNKGDIVEVDERHRGIGKTKILVDIASKKGLPVVVGTQTEYNLIKLYNDSVEIIRLAPNFTFEIRGRAEKYPNGVLVDDSMADEMIDELVKNNFKIRGGFVKSRYTK